jgi:hypothetical protein
LPSYNLIQIISNVHSVTVLWFVAGQLKQAPDEQMSDVEPDDDADVVMLHEDAPAVVVNGQPTHQPSYQLSTKAFYGVPMSSDRRGPIRKRTELEGFENVSATNNPKVGQIAPSIRKTRRECLPPRRYND